MTVSRTSRILIGFLLLIVAVFLWVNLYMTGGGASVSFLQFLRAAPAPSAQSIEQSQPAAPGQAAPGQAADAQAADGQAVAPVPQARVARELEVLDLPFLVTEPPAPEAEPEQVEAEAATAQAAARRATVNPFSPIIQRSAAAEAPAPAQTQPEPQAQPQPQPREVVTEVQVPTAPPATSSQAMASAAPTAPAPPPVTPRAQGTSTLPRALPTGTIGGTPELLHSAIGSGPAQTEELPQVAAVREPETAAPELAQAGEEAAAAVSEPEPLTEPVNGSATGEATATAEVQEQLAVSAPPLEAGTSALSRYLRDNNVRFTGSVIGPVSVGVFRSSVTAAPVVISLGQSLPDTSIVLTDLRGQQAEFTLGDTTQNLTLELRR